MVLVWDHEVDIFMKEIFNSLFGEAFELIEETSKYDYRMNNLKWVKKLIMYDKVLYYMLLEDHIVEVQWMHHRQTE